jgi:hypothetical protein
MSDKEEGEKKDAKAAFKEIADKVLRFLKARWVPVVCATLVVAAPLSAWLLLDVVRQPIVNELKRRSDAFDKLAATEKVPVEVRKADGTTASETMALNDEIVRRVAANNRSLGGGSMALYEQAVRRNRGCDVSEACDSPRLRVAPELVAWLPAPAAASRRTVALLREEGFGPAEKIRDALLKTYGVDTAPKPSAVLENVQRAEQEYLVGTLRKRSRSEITEPRELEALNQHLIDARKEFLVQHAAQVAFYMDPWAINWPGVPQESADKSDTPAAFDRALCVLFQFQWDLWLVDDVLSAIRRVNEEGASSGAASAAIRGPMVAPVKRILELQISPIGQPAGSEAGGSPPAEEATEAAAGPTGEAIDPKAAIEPDFAASMTGLKSNQLFDVRTARLRVIVETAAIPRLIDGLARQNFISVSGLTMAPVDAFAAAKQGYVYGPQPCSDVTLTLQSIWFREWVTERMPAPMRKALNTAGPAPKEPAADTAAPAEGTPQG